jgi:cytochrome c oxidase assembly protein subunit 11
MSRGARTGDSRRRRHRTLACSLALVAAGMVGAAYAAVPLYNLFCRVTGYGGTTRVASAPAPEVGERVVTVRFNGDVQSDLPWRFAPEQRAVKVHVGETALAYFRAENLGDKPLVGTATFNVTPQIAGAYFDKIDCFCFSEQFLEPGEAADLAVSFFVDPAIADDPDTAEITTLTLSYMFFDAGADALARHLDAGPAVN